MPRVTAKSFDEFWEKYLKADFDEAKIKRKMLPVNTSFYRATDGTDIEIAFISNNFLSRRYKELANYSVWEIGHNKLLYSGWMTTGHIINRHDMAGKDLIALLIAGIDHDTDGFGLSFSGCEVGSLAIRYLREKEIPTGWHYKTTAIDCPIDYLEKDESEMAKRSLDFYDSSKKTYQDLEVLKYLLNEIVNKDYLVTFFEAPTVRSLPPQVYLSRYFTHSRAPL